jgi:hypothetical protein
MQVHAVEQHSGISLLPVRIAACLSDPRLFFSFQQ